MYFNIEIFSSEDDRMPLAMAGGSADRLVEVFQLVSQAQEAAKEQLRERGLKS